MRNNSYSSAIAIVGMACHYPGANNLRLFWENILARKRQFRPFPDQRLPLSDYYDPDPAAPDKTYCNKAALIDGFKFDWAGKRIPKSAFESTDIAHWLALDVALQSLKDAGFNRSNVPNEKTGVILGNTLTGEHSRAEGLRLRWPFVRRTLEAAARSKGLSPQAHSELIQTMEAYYKSVFVPVTEDTLSGGLSNTIAGRICNYLDFHGGGYTVDGACSSSLVAVSTAATALSNGDLDLALAGGVDISLDTFEMIGFAKTSALTRSDMRVYDRRADGFLPGEGCGFVVMKRLQDAVKDGNPVYAVLRGWGISSDGKGGLTAPSVKGQAMALRRAYDRAGYSPNDLDFIEGHGTGTVVGDKTELEAISLAMGEGKENIFRRCGITSLKSIVGHTKAASGIGGFIKAVIAVNRRVLPPTANCMEPNNVFQSSVHNLYPIITGQICEPTKKIKAGISAMGFGGINCHVTIESADSPADNLTPSIEERKLLVSHQETELFVLGARSITDLRELTRAAKSRAKDICEGELVDLAVQLSRELETDASVRAGMVAGTPEEVLEGLESIERMLIDNPPPAGEKATTPGQNIFIGNKVLKNRVGFLFPGQGSQFLNMGYSLMQRHEWAQSLLSDAALWLEESGGKDITQFIYKPLEIAVDDDQIREWSELLKQTEIAQPAICLTSLLWINKLNRLGIRPVAVGGHSLGELTAFYAAGAFDERTLLKLASIRGQAMGAHGDERGIMASLACSEETAADLLNHVKGYAVIANINSPRQTIISGERSCVEEAVNAANNKGITTHVLEVSNAFHSRFVASAADKLRGSASVPELMNKIKTKLYTGINGREIREVINLRDHFVNQILSQVDFVSMVNSMASHCDLMLEVGPGRVLSNLANATIKSNHPECLSIESKQQKDHDLNAFLASFFVSGGDVRWKELYEDRLTRPFIPASERIFIENPCERSSNVSDQESLTVQDNGKSLISALSENSNISKQVLADYLSRRHQFIEAVIKADLENLPPHSIAEAASLSMDAQDISKASAHSENTGTLSADNSSSDTDVSVSGLIFELVEKRTGFPRESLTMELRLLDDLNLDSIKAAELIAEASMRLGVAGNMDVSRYANATIKEVANTLETLKKGQGLTSTQVRSQESRTERSEWVRNFVFKPVIEELPEEEKGDWQGKNVLVLSELEESRLARVLEKQLAQEGAQVQVKLYKDAGSQESYSNDQHTVLIAILPGTPRKAELDKGRLEKIIDRLRTISTLPFSSKSRGKIKTIAYIQFGGGHFGLRPEVSGIEQCTSMALAASMHLEHPELIVRVIDFAPEIRTEQITKKIAEELLTSNNYAAVGFDRKLTRCVPKPCVHEPSRYHPRKISWTPEDVLLVTGGAKGITAECSFALARTTKVRMALIGSSPHPHDDSASHGGDEIALTLKRFSEAGLTSRYYQCDITDTDSVMRVVKQIQSELGNITGVIHGSALNKPGDLNMVSTLEALNEVSPKVLGAVNLCTALKDSPPKLFIGFSSIIGLSGMNRNAWYGFSNEALNLILSRFEQDHPETSVLSIAFSIWDDVGMGVRMGSTRYLAKMGIGAIPSGEGVRRFLQLIKNDPGEKQVVVAARIDGIDTFKPEPFPFPKNSRFLERIVYYYPEVEVVARARLSIQKDPYVRDHLWRGTYLFPTVFGLEAMAQAVAYVTGESLFDSLLIEDIKLERPIPVSPGNGTEIEIRAEVLERETGKGARRIRVGIAIEQTGYTIDHFSAIFVLNLHKKAPKEQVKLPRIPLGIQPENDLYNGRLLFQGPMFQRIKKIYSLNSQKCVFRSEIKSPDSSPWLLGDPFFRDSLLHSAQLPVSRDISLPLKINSIERYRIDEGTHKTLTGVAIIESRTDVEISATVIAISENGRLVERIKGYVLRILEHHDDYPTAEEIADRGRLDERILREEITKRAQALGLLVPDISVAYMPGLHRLTKQERHKKQLPFLRQVISSKVNNRINSTKNIKVRWLESGKPTLHGLADKDIDISLSHDEDTLFCVTGSGSQGCDIATVSGRKKQEWLALLGSAKEPLLQKLPEGGDSLDRAGTRIWAATEAFRKATNSAEADLTIEMQTDDTVVFRSERSNREFRTLTFPVKLTGSPERIVAVVAQANGYPKQAYRPVSGTGKTMHLKRLNFDLESYKADIVNGTKGQPVFIFQFPVTFKEASNPSRTLYFSHYFAWIGKLREFMVHPIYDKLVEWFSTGKWGMVTNHAETRISGEAKPGDVIEGRLWLDKVHGQAQSTLEFYFEWRKLLPGRGSELIAVSKMSTTWVAIKGHGIVEVKPLPEFGQEFVNKLLPSADSDQKNDSTPLISSHSDPGELLYSEPDGPVKTSSLLHEQTFETTLEDANLVGNIYFSNYYIWQGRVRDNFLNKVIPEYFGASGKEGELRCVQCAVNHMSEAMPFERIAVRMYRSAVYERGIRLHFDYYRITEDGRRHKLGHGEHEAVWFAPDRDKWVPAELPFALRSTVIPKEKEDHDVSSTSFRKDKNNKHDVIIVGAGIGGLTAGALLAKWGKRVLVLEQHDKPGGFCTSWERYVKHKNKKLRFVFDAGVHDIAFFGQYSQVSQLMRELNIENRIEWMRMDQEYFLPDLQLKVPRRLEDYIEVLSNQFPAERQALISYFQEIKICLSEIYERMLLSKPMSSLHISRWANVSLEKMLDIYFRDYKLKKVLSILSIYFTDNPSILNVGVAILLFGYYIYGGYYPKGGSQVLSDIIAETIETRGGNIRLKTPVRRIIASNGCARGIELTNGERLRAETVISNADIRRTILELVGSEYLPSHFSRQIENLQPSGSAFLISLGVDFVPEVEPVTMVVEENEQIHIVIPSKVDPTLSPKGYSVITIIMLLPREQAVTWNRSAPDYVERKQKLADKLISLAEKAIPKLRKHIIFRQEASPATFARYAWTTDGAIYGLAIDQWRPPMKTPINGLYLVGAGASVRPGIEDAVHTGIRAAEIIMAEHKVPRK